MFSPSLLSLMWHTLQQGLKGEFAGERNLHLRSMGEILHRLHDLAIQYRDRVTEIARVPTLGHTQKQPCELAEDAQFAVAQNQPFLFGRVPIDRLVAHLSNAYELGTDVEFLDLGTPLSMTQHAASTSAAYQRCRQRMSQTGTSTGSHLSIAFIDEGIRTFGPPHNFNNTLVHATSQGVDLSTHAIDVLDVLLERLDYHGLLAECEMYCALVAPPQNPIGLQCFKHANSVELLGAVTALDQLLKTSTPDSQPVFANLSMGTHVGPHDGNSPLEGFIHSSFDIQHDRYMHVAAGNHGLRGTAAVRPLVANIAEYLRMRVGPTGCTELLLELWWDATPDADLRVSVEVSRAGQHLTPWPLAIDSTQTGATLQVAGYAGSLMCQSLFHARCYGARSCIALALSAGNASDLSDVDIDLTMTSTVDVVVNAWIVVCSDERSAFITGGNVGSILVPATDPGVISVAGIISNGQPWAASSRGPTAGYGSSVQSNMIPCLAHRVDAGLKAGTSFASPRACADAANLRRSGTKISPWASAQEVAKDIVASRSAVPIRAWNARTGFGAVQ